MVEQIAEGRLPDATRIFQQVALAQPTSRQPYFPPGISTQHRTSLNHA